MVADPTLLNPKEFPIMCQDGKEKTLIFSKIPAVQMREIICKITAASVPDIEKYEINQETMLKMMAYVAVPMKTGVDLRLTTAELVNSHIPDWEALDRAEKCLLQYNCSFFLADRPLTFFELCLQMVKQRATEISTILLQPLSQMEKQHSMN